MQINPTYQFDSKIFDGFHFLPTASAIIFTNYAARWIPIHIHDMKSLPITFETRFKKDWGVSKTKKIFSCMPHEQENAKVKGKG